MIVDVKEYKYNIFYAELVFEMGDEAIKELQLEIERLGGTI